MTVPIKTARLLLTPLKASDAGAIFEITGLEVVRKNFLTPAWVSFVSSRRWISGILTGQGLIYTMRLLSPAASLPRDIIGAVGLGLWDTVTYFLHPSHWNHGYCTEALLAFLENLWMKEPGRVFVDASVMEGNEASKRVLEKCGFTRFERGVRPVFEKQRGNAVNEKGEGVGHKAKDEEEEILTERTIDALKRAIDEMKIQTRPFIEPVKTDTGIETMPISSTKLVGYRICRQLW